ncbi:MAG: type I polyketide synthase [Kineosporiaceae bacterium]
MGEGTVEPIAVIGLSCRFPGADGPDDFWQLLRDGVDAVTAAPAARWPGHALPDYRRGGFVDGIEDFDAAFFGIDDAEADAMDPQHRMALQLAWHAVEDARTPLDRLCDRGVGVFAAAGGDGYARLAHGLTHRHGTLEVTRHSYIGTHPAMLANRISYALGLRGPSITVDSGQSSGLVAVHLACESLRRRESAVALATAVSLLVLAETTREIAELGVLSPDGRCHVLDARANGYVRGEGGGAVLLKPLASAVADGDPVRGVILGSAVNNDGGGAVLTTPTAAAQHEVIEKARVAAGVDPARIGYVELHGTGTRVGDPVEAAALGEAVGRHRAPGQPLPVGSVKTSIGHLEGASGMAGLTKALLAVAHRELPGDVGHEQDNPEIPMSELGLRVVDRTQPWPPSGDRCVAGVSSFGMGGTNCHLLVAASPVTAERSTGPAVTAHPEPPRERPRATPVAGDLPLLVSTRSVGALRAAAGLLGDRLDSGLDAAQVATALRHTRSQLPQRAAVLGHDPRSALAALAEGRSHPDVVTGAALHGDAPRTFIFPGQGSQWPGMAAELLQQSTVFADQVHECAEALAPFVDWDLLDVLRGSPGSVDGTRVDVVQPALWSVMVGLAAVWRTAGVRPEVVIGHSQGEIAAATVVGALSVADGARVVALRSISLAALAGSGRMLSVAADVNTVAQALAEHAPEATVAVINGPRSTVVSGRPGDLAELEGQLIVAGYRTRHVAVDYASHSSDVERVREELLDRLAPVAPRSVEATFLSTVDGRPVDTATLDAHYWYRSLREPVRFGPAVARSIEAGSRIFVECSPHPILSAAVEETAEAAGADVTVVATLRREEGAAEQVRRALGQAWTAGLPVDWEAGRPPGPPRSGMVALPAYPFEQRRHWLGIDRSITRPRPTTNPLAVDAVRDLVARITAEARGDAAVEPDHDVTFTDLGIDSVRALDMRNRLRDATGLALPAAVVFDHPTPAQLTAHLVAGLADAAGTARATASDRVEVGAGATPGRDDEDPVAVVAMACRYPGDVGSPEQLWQLVAGGVDAVGPLPRDRGWDVAEVTRQVPDRGGFLSGAGDFDAPFFGVSPREALAMDPQQRLMLTLCWEALERAGIDPQGLRASATGVFVGAMAPDYGPRLHEPSAAGGHLLTGSALSVLSGRIAYTLGLEGPAITVDTACSASLVALHLAVQSLRRRECVLALAGGVTVMSTPGMFVEFARQGGLAADGRCKAFSAAADGTGWAEGAGVLVLQRLSDAQAAGRPVLALVRGSAVNQDGRSNGLTAPNGPAQERVIRQALADARLDPGDILAVEAHGTGTKLGDPIEAAALQATYGAAHGGDDPVWLGSLKSNTGHTQAAAGVGSVIKMVMAMLARSLPRTLHVTHATPHVPWDAGGLRLLTSAVPLPTGTGTPVRVAVSGFGISGTNSHVILEEAPPTPRAAPEPAPTARSSTALVWAFSAATASGLRAFAARLRDRATDRATDDSADVGADLTTVGDDLDAVGRELAGRSRFEHRAVVVAHGSDDLVAALEAVADGTSHPAAQVGRAAPDVRPILLFPGQGSQWDGMASALLDGSETFWESMCRFDGALGRHVDWSALDVLRQEPDAPVLTGSEVVQPVLAAVMASLATMWRTAGIEPAAVVGHSQGELTAAWTAGVLSLEELARIVTLRSRCLAARAPSGGMLAVPLDAGRAAELADPWRDRLWVAVHNSPAASVIAGDVTALDEFEAAHAARLPMLRRLPVDYASHTPHVDALAPELAGIMAGVSPRAGTVPFCSTVTGRFVGPGDLDADYWVENLRRPVRFEEAIRTTAAEGTGTPLFIEVSPHPVLVNHVRDTLEALGRDGVVVGTLTRHEGDRADLLRSVGAAFVAGAAVDWAALLGPAPTRRTAPTYPFQGERFWMSPEPAANRSSPATRTGDEGRLAQVLPLPDGTVLGTAQVAATGWLADHVVADTTLLPGAAVVDLVLATGRTVGCPVLDDLVLLAPLVLGQGESSIQVHLDPPADDGSRGVTVHGRPVAATGWTRHAIGRCSAGTAVPAGAAPSPQESWPPPWDEIDVAGAYERLAARGYHYGPGLRRLRRAWRSADGTVLAAEVAGAGPAGVRTSPVPPALLDGALHPLLMAEAVTGSSDDLLLPSSWSGVRLADEGVREESGVLRVVLTRDVRSDVGHSLVADDTAGRRVITVERLTLRRAPAWQVGGPGRSDPLPEPGGMTRPASRPATQPIGEPVQKVAWLDLDVGPGDPLGIRWALLGDDLDTLVGIESAGIPLESHDTLAALTADPHGVPDLVVVAAEGPGGTDIPDAVRVALVRALHTLQGWLADERTSGSRLLVLTRPGVAGAAVRGLLRAAGAEHPGRVATAQVAPGGHGAWPGIAAAVAAGETEVVADDQGRLRVPRLLPAARGEAPPPGAESWSATDTVLVTGGTGRVGAVVTEHLVRRHGVRHLLLLSRRGDGDAAAGALTARLTDAGAQVTVAAVDTADRPALARALDAIPADHPLGAVVHAAGVLADAPLDRLDPSALDAVLRPKIDAAWHLHELTRDLPIQHFVVLSSVAGTLGLPGQANYAAANAALDELIQLRRDAGLTGQSLVWGLWSPGPGMTDVVGRVEHARLARAGVAALSDAEGLALLDAALASGEAVPVVARWVSGGRPDLRSALFRRAPGGAVDPEPGLAFSAAPSGRSAPSQELAGIGERDVATRGRLAELPPAAAREHLLQVVREVVADVLGYPGIGHVQPDRTFVELGLDSLTLVELRNRLGSATGLRLPATLAFDHPTVFALAERLADDLVPAEPTAQDALRAALDRVSAEVGRDASSRPQLVAILHGALDRLTGHGPDADTPAAPDGLDDDTALFDYLDAR